MVLDGFAFGVQQIVETNEKCVTTIIADNGPYGCLLFIYPPAQTDVVSF